MAVDDKIEVRVLDPGAKEHKARLPRSKPVGELAVAIAEKLRFPSDPNQEYVLYDKQQGKRLDPSRTLEEQGVSEGAVLQLLGEQRAG
jgi:hypothetical protein